MKKAFTLIEMIAVISILGIILMIAVLNISQFYTILEEDEINTFVNDLNYARRLAITSREDVMVLIDEDGKGYEIRLNSDKDFANKDYDFTRLTIISNTSTSNGRLTFKAKGTVANPLTYILEGEDGNYEVSIQVATGKVNVRKI